MTTPDASHIHLSETVPDAAHGIEVRGTPLLVTPGTTLVLVFGQDAPEVEGYVNEVVQMLPAGADLCVVLGSDLAVVGTVDGFTTQAVRQVLEDQELDVQAKAERLVAMSTSAHVRLHIGGRS